MKEKEIRQVECPTCGKQHPITQLMALGFHCPDCGAYDYTAEKDFEERMFGSYGKREDNK